MIFLGFGKYARADKIYALEPIRDERRGHGRRTLVWVEGVSEPIVQLRGNRGHEKEQESPRRELDVRVGEHSNDRRVERHCSEHHPACRLRDLWQRLVSDNGRQCCKA